MDSLVILGVGGPVQTLAYFCAGWVPGWYIPDGEYRISTIHANQYDSTLTKTLKNEIQKDPMCYRTGWHVLPFFFSLRFTK